MLSTLRHRNFALLWLSVVISLTGDRALLVALPVYVYQRTGSTLAMAGIFGAYYLPTFLFSSVAGVFVDRWDRKRILVVTNLIQGAVMLLLLLLQSGTWLWLVYLVTFVQMTLAMFTMPAEGALLPNLVEESHLIQANALTGIGNTVARLVGPLVGGALIGAFGLGSVVFVDSASFVLAALLVMGITVRPQPVTAGRSTDSREQVGMARALIASWSKLLTEWREGLQLVLHTRLLVALFVVMNITSLGGTLIDPLFAPFVLDRLHGGAQGLGFLETIGAVGGLLGGLVVGWVGNRIAPRYMVGYGTLVVGVFMLAIYNQTSLVPAAVLNCIMTIVVVMASVASSTMLQSGTPDRYRGRIYGALGTTNALIGLVSVGLAGALGHIVGIVPMLSLAGGITLLAGVLALMLLPSAPGKIQEAKDAEMQVGEEVA